MLEVDEATAEDHDGIRALTRQAFGEADQLMVRARLEGPRAARARWTVVRDAGRVVSTSVLLPFPLRLDGLDLPAGQIEFVATDPAYRGRGLVRRQIERHHRRSAEAGHLLQIILGIPYFYRQFGYGYGVDDPRLYQVPAGALRPDPDVAIRPARLAELDDPTLTALDRLRPAEGLTTDGRAALELLVWASELADPAASGPERTFVATRAGAVVGVSSLTVSEGRTYLLPALAADDGATDALLAHARAQAPAPDVLAQDTPGTAYGRRLAVVGTPLPFGPGVYVRIADPLAFLRAVRPVLSARLRASPLAAAEGSVTLSFFVDAVRIGYEGGEITEVARVPPVEDPFEQQECGVAPDWFPALALGRWGARGLEERVDDVSLGRHADVLATLFPRRPADIVTGF